MSNDPDQIRAEIEETRENLSRNVDALTDSVKPSTMARRQGQKISDSVAGLKDRIMGSDDDRDRLGEARGRMSDAAGQARASGENLKDQAGQQLADAQQAVAQAPAAARRQTQGNPLAAGLIALGVGWLVGSLMPSSQQEQQASLALKEKAQPLAEQAQAVAKEAGESLKPQVQEAVEAVKVAATDAAENVKAEGKDSAADLKASAQDAKGTVQDSRNA